MANINIGGRLHSTASGNVVAGANEILDDSKGKKQSVINQETGEALAGKQATIEDLSTIRSGAAAGATAYQKPGTGIPKTDLAEAVQTSLGKADTAYQKPGTGVPSTDMSSAVQTSLGKADTAYQKPSGGIPASDIASGVIPAISTNIGTDGSSDSKVASPKAVKTYVDNQVNGVFVTAWDGSSTPVIANIPSGVSVTYNTTTYTGTLVASSSTKGKIYLVSAGSGLFHRYITELNGSTYSWVYLGTTAIALSDYATKTEVDQLEHKVGEIQGGEEIPQTIDIYDYSQFAWIISNQNLWARQSGGSYNGKCIILSLDGVTKVSVSASGGNGTIAFLNSYEFENNETPDFSSDYPERITILDGETANYDLPDDANFLYLYSALSAGTDIRDRYESVVFTYFNGGIVYKEDFLPYVSAGYVENDLSDYTVYDGGLGSASTWYMAGKHILMRVTPGKAMRLKPIVESGSSQGSFFGWLTSSHSEPVDASTTIDYLPGTSRNWVNNLVEKEVIVPDGAYYLCLCYKTGDGEMVWNVWTATEKSLLVGRAEVVDNVYAGGKDVPLSAEQGKFIAERLVTPIPAGVTKHNIEGGLYKFTKAQHHIGTGVVATVTAQNFQGGACYGNYLFMFTENNTTCWMYDLSTNALVQTITIPAAERGFVEDCHCNTVNFGTEKYAPDDQFPLIYVSTGYASGDYSGALVYRIVATTVNDATTYSLSLVQTIKLPKVEGASWTEFVVGVDGNCFVCLTYRRLIYRMKMPKLSEGDIILDYANALESYQFTPQEFESSNQNRLYYNGKMYVISGSTGAVLLIVLDLLTRTREAVIDLNAIGITNEPEADFIWNGNLCVVCRNDASVHALHFD